MLLATTALFARPELLRPSAPPAAHAAELATATTQPELPPRQLTITEVALVPGSDTRHVWAADGIVYVIDGVQLQLYDVSTPAQPRLRGSLGLPQSASQLQVVGDRIYLALRDDGFAIIDGSNPDQPVQIGHYADWVDDFTIVGSQAYLVGQHAGLRVIDVRDPATPTLIGRFAEWSTQVVGGGGLAFTSADSTVGLRIVDLADPARPAQRGNLLGTVRALALADGQLYMAGDSLAKVDYRNPDAPTIMGSTPIAAAATSLQLAGELALLTIDYAGLHFYDIRTATPRFAGIYHPWDLTTTSDVAVDGDLVYLAGESAGLRVLRLTYAPPSSPTPTPTRAPAPDLRIEPLSHIVGADPIQFFAIADRMAYVVVGQKLRIYDLADPTRPLERSFFDLSADICGVTVQNNRAYVCTFSQGLQIIDVTDPVAPQLLGSYNPGHQLERVSMANDRAYLGLGHGGLQIVAVDDPRAPQLLGSFTQVGWYFDTAQVYDNRAYQPVGSVDGLRIFDVTQPAAPRLIGGYSPPGYRFWTPNALQVVDDLLYTSDFPGGLSILHVANAFRPALLSRYRPTTAYQEVRIQEGIAYLTASEGFVELVDVRDPAAPVAITQRTVPGSPAKLHVQGDLLFIASEAAGLHIMRVVPASSPTPTPTASPTAAVYSEMR